MYDVSQLAKKQLRVSKLTEPRPEITAKNTHTHTNIFDRISKTWLFLSHRFRALAPFYVIYYYIFTSFYFNELSF
jgi:hypothetical protein